MTKIALELEPNIDGSFNYYPGHILKGIVVLTTEHSKICRGFYVEVYGRGKSDWMERTGRTTTRYMGKEEYVRSRSYLLGQYEGPTFILPPGINKYKFSCQLPYQLPYSLNLKYGCINYHVKAVLDIPWKMDIDTELEFKVLRYDDLNFYPQLRNLLKDDAAFKMSLLEGDSDTLNMTVTIPCTGFSINQFAPVTIGYENKSRVEISRTKIKLIQTIIYNSPIMQNIKIKESVVCESITEGVQARISKTIQAGIGIPKVMTSNEEFSQVIIVQYFIEVEAEAKRIRKNLKVRLPVTIGTVPLLYENPNTGREMMEHS